MSDGFQVVMSDLQEAATTFHAEAKTFLGVMPDACPALPDGGSGAFNESLSAVVDAACLLHLQIGGDIDDNGTKLQTGSYDSEMHKLVSQAKTYLDSEALNNDFDGLQPAIVLDVDDTTLNTYSYEIYSNFVFNPTTNAAFVM